MSTVVEWRNTNLMIDWLCPAKTELKLEDTNSFFNYIRVELQIFDELLHRVSVAQIGALWTTLISSPFLQRFRYDGVRCLRLVYAAATTMDFLLRWCGVSCHFFTEHRCSVLALSRVKKAPQWAAHGASRHFSYAHAVHIPFVLRSVALLGDLDQFCHRTGRAGQWNGGISWLCHSTGRPKVFNTLGRLATNQHLNMWGQFYTSC